MSMFSYRLLTCHLNINQCRTARLTASLFGGAVLPSCNIGCDKRSPCALNSQHNLYNAVQVFGMASAGTWKSYADRRLLRCLGLP